jgi:indole-3-glycerol phosphate synthase
MSILDKIVEQTRVDLRKRKHERSLSSLEQSWGFERTHRSFKTALAAEGVQFITEVKKASPSKGVIRENFDPLEIAQIYQEYGAAALSVLTDEPFFQGHLRYMESISQKVSIPVLRKDFIVDPYQIVEAKAYGADAILLIVRILTDTQLNELLDAAYELKLDVLVECYDSEEQDRLDFDKISILGVNNRDLERFEVDVHRGVAQLQQAPDGIIRVSESGISTPNDIAFLHEEHIDAVLIGEHLMRQQDIAAALTELTSTAIRLAEQTQIRDL